MAKSERGLMSATRTEISAPVRVPKRAPRRGGISAGAVAAKPLGLLEQIASMVLLTGKTIIACVTPPFSWKYDFVDEAWLIVRRCTIPVIISTTAFGFGAPGLQASDL